MTDESNPSNHSHSLSGHSKLSFGPCKISTDSLINIAIYSTSSCFCHQSDNDTKWKVPQMETGHQTEM